ncbi:hypothetical protein EUGRSUZ_D01355 [Eucalyptus grandis]|uniref:Uncharacterized protein n=2 Tax=Eucalyptus grandis TaxID=71139 RepID=A0A059CFS6_EUCGR|nr:hypothetical protein EUGRSUZ_D01355 [Eucalyptus grandis]
MAGAASPPPGIFPRGPRLPTLALSSNVFRLLFFFNRAFQLLFTIQLSIESASGDVDEGTIYIVKRNWLWFGADGV